MSDEDRKQASKIDDKKTQLIWVSLILMLGVAILFAEFLKFDFWMCAGVFLVGFGALSFCIKMFAYGRSKVPIFPLILVLIGAALIGNSIFNMSSLLIIGVIFIIIAAVAAIFIIIRK